jgi:ABC-2 type transport system ATP-binding protein
VLLTTQYLEEADRLADNIIVIDDGKVIAEGAAAQLKAGLGNTIVEVEMLDAAGAQAVTARLGQLGSAEVLDDGRTVAVRVGEGGRSILEVVRTLDAAGLNPESLAIREPTLDDVFLQLTGHTVADAGPEASGAAGPVPAGYHRGAA